MDGSIVFARLRQCAPHLTCILGRSWAYTRVHIQNGISIGLAFFAGLTIVTDRETDRQTDHGKDRPRCSVCRIYVRGTAMRSNDVDTSCVRRRLEGSSVIDDEHLV